MNGPSDFGFYLNPFLLSHFTPITFGAAKRKGRYLGRPCGRGMTNKQFLAKHKDVVKRLKEGLSVRVTAAATGKSPFTVQKVRKMMGDKGGSI